MVLDQMILDELKKIDLNGITVLSVVCEPEAIQVVFEMPPAQVEFRVGNDYQFQILSVTYNNVVYNDPRYLAQFRDFVVDVMVKVKMVEAKKRIEFDALKKKNENLVQGRLEALILREERIKEQEQQLDLKEQEIKEREKLLHDREDKIALQWQEERLKEEALKNQNRERLKKMLRDSVNRL